LKTAAFSSSVVESNSGSAARESGSAGGRGKDSSDGAALNYDMRTKMRRAKRQRADDVWTELSHTEPASPVRPLQFGVFAADDRISQCV
jgi:hypothetical protein